MSSQTTEAAEIRRRGRHRLIGAIAIVALLVIFVPMIFDREPRAPQPEPSLEIPAKDQVAPLLGRHNNGAYAPRSDFLSYEFEEERVRKARYA